MKKHILILALSTLIVANVKSQTPTPTKTQVFFEKVYLRTDREAYVAGENLWYSASLVNAQDNRLLNSSNTLYVELSPTSKTYDAKKQIIRLDNGKGHGDFELPEELQSGTYVLRAWTNWMRNFGDNFIFEKEINILEKPQTDAAKKEQATKQSSKTSKAPSTVKSEEISFQFSPEGGSLIDDVASVVAFKTNYIGATVKLAINDSKGNLITEAENVKGSGSFLLKPTPGETYYIKGNLANGKTFNQQLPKALATGYAIYITEKDSLYQVIVSTNSHSNLIGKDVLLIGKNHGLIRFKTQFTLSNVQQMVKIYKNTLPAGITAITLYDSEGRPNCERLIYLEDPKKPLVSIATDKKTYKADEDIKVSIKVSDAANQPLQGVFSVAVLDDAVAKFETSNITSYLMLESELKGRIDDAKNYFDTTNPLRKRQLDLLLLTQGWRDFIWKKIADSTLHIGHIPETGITVTGTVQRKVGNKPIPSSNVTIRSVGENQSQLFFGATNTSGRFFIDGLKFDGAQQFRVNAVNKKTSNEGWIKLDPLFKSVPFKAGQFTTSEEANLLNMGNQILDRYTLLQAKNSLNRVIMLDEVKVQDKYAPLINGVKLTDMGYKNEDFEIIPSDSTYQNLSHYLLANAKQAKMDTGSNNHLVFYSGLTKIHPRFVVNNKELFFMDDEGVNMTTEDGNDIPLDTEIRDNIYDTYLNLSMSEINHVSIRRMIGVSTNSIQPRDYFVIFLDLKEGTTLGGKSNPIVATVNGYYQAREFNAENPEYQTRQMNNITSYWNPLVETDKNGEASFHFRGPGAETNLRVNIEGVSTSGNTIVGEQTVQMK